MELIDYSKLDSKRLFRQLNIIQSWIKDFNACGVVEACTGFGKTMIAILAIKRLHLKYPHAKIIVVVPSIPLREDWIKERGHIKTHSLKNIEVFVINTYISTFHKCDLIVADEIHNYAAEEFSKLFSQTIYKFILGLTATLERNDGKHILIEELCPIVDRVSLDEAKREGYISNFKTFNLLLEFNEEDAEEYSKLHNMFNSNFAKFSHNFALAMACTMGNNVTYKIGSEFKTGGEWRQGLASSQDWDGTDGDFWSPKSIYKYAQQWSFAMRKRKEMLYNAKPKIEALLEIINRFPLKTMIFCETAEFADKITKELGTICRSYHTKVEPQIRSIRKEKETKTKGTVVTYTDKKFGKKALNDESLDLFRNSKEVRVLSTVKALDEGFDFEGIELIIMASYSSSKRQDTQRTGRGVRKDEANPEKCSLIINFCIKNTQEEKWLKNKQLGKRNIIEVSEVKSITLEGKILEGSLKLV